MSFLQYDKLLRPIKNLLNCNLLKHKPAGTSGPRHLQTALLSTASKLLEALLGDSKPDRNCILDRQNEAVTFHYNKFPRPPSLALDTADGQLLGYRLPVAVRHKFCHSVDCGLVQ